MSNIQKLNKIRDQSHTQPKNYQNDDQNKTYLSKFITQSQTE